MDRDLETGARQLLWGTTHTFNFSAAHICLRDKHVCRFIVVLLIFLILQIKRNRDNPKFVQTIETYQGMQNLNLATATQTQIQSNKNVGKHQIIYLMAKIVKELIGTNIYNGTKTF